MKSALGTMPRPNNHSTATRKRIPIAQRQPGGPAFIQTGGGLQQPQMPQTGGGLQAPNMPQYMPMGNPQMMGMIGGGMGYQNTMNFPQQFQQGMPQAQNMMQHYAPGQAPNAQMMGQMLAKYTR